MRDMPLYLASGRRPRQSTGRAPSFPGHTAMHRHSLALLALAALACSPADSEKQQDSVATAAPAPAAAPAAQPIASPRDSAEGTVGGAKVLVDYGRPSKRGRVIFSETGLAPYGQVWRTGANAATTLVTSAPLMVGETALPAGTYTLYTIPGPDRWQLVINGQTGQWGTEYDQSKDVARVPMQVTALSAPVEQFEIAVENSALVMRWDTVQASVPLKAGK